MKMFLDKYSSLRPVLFSIVTTMKRKYENSKLIFKQNPKSNSTLKQLQWQYSHILFPRSGDVTLLNQTYHYKTQVTLAEPSEGFHGGSDFSLEVTTPHSSNVLETNCKVDHHDTATKVYSTVMFTSTHNEKYRLTNFFGLEMGEEPHEYKVDSEVILSTPGVKDARVQARLKYHGHPFHRNINAQVTV